MSKALAALGLVCYQQRPDQLVVSSQEGPVWPDRGNSFWLSHKDGVWYLSTWGPVGYQIPREQDAVALCSTCMSIGGSAMSRVPSDVASKFQLRQLDDHEYERVFGFANDERD